MRKFFLFIALMISGVGLINAQSTNNDDEVVKIDYMNRFNSVEGEIIVKFADNTPFGLEYDRDNKLKSTGISTVDKVLKRYELVSIDRLCLTTTLSASCVLQKVITAVMWWNAT